MELGRILRRSSKAQLMTIIMLVLFMLMLAVLFALAQLNITSNSVVQSLALSSTSNNYGNLLKLSANNFAKESLDRAIVVLANYEYTPNQRKGNFISNFSYYASNLMISGILPSDTSGYPQNAMGNLTLTSYNRSIVSLLGFVPQGVVINETRPMIFQTDSYNLRASYTERILINASGNRYQYNIQVNVSIPLNIAPDLFYAQQGILRNVDLASLSNITSMVGGAYATSGNAISYAYGTVYTVPSSASSGATCPLPTPGNFIKAPLNQSLIIATYNGINLGRGTCIDKYAGLITYIAPTSLPSNVPYLVYASSSNTLALIPNGTKVLLYGPGLATLNIEGLRSAIINHNYFASPYTPSYIDRANAQFAKQSPNGIFTFSNYDTQTTNFNGATSYISVPPSSTNSRTVSVWINTPALSSSLNYPLLVGGITNQGDFLEVQGTGCANVCIDHWGGISLTINNNLAVPLNTWVHLVFAFDTTTSTITVYVNGNLDLVYSGAFYTWGAGTIYLGYNKIGGSTATTYYKGSISNVQIYSSSLSASQVQQLYQEGISALPISTNTLVGWWPLNGNANDYGGNGNIGTANTITYALPLNYARDSILNTPVPTQVSPLPGILSCNNFAQCGSNTLSQLYLGYMPLEPQSGYMETANFNGASSYIDAGNNGILQMTTQLSVSFWIYPTSTSAYQYLVAKGTAQTTGWWSQINTGTSSTIFCVGASPSCLCTPGQTLTLNAWQLVTYTYSAGVGKYCLNGACTSYSGLPSSVPSAATYDLTIGSGPSVSYPFSGRIANVQLYNSALSANMIQALYREGMGGLPFSSNVVGWWPLNGDANDYSGFSNNGVATKVVYPYFAGTYNAPGMSTITTPANEWQALGLANT